MNNLNIDSERPLMLIFGYGYTAQYLTQHLLNTTNLQVIATTRQPSESYLTAIKLVNFHEPILSDLIKRANFILITTPPNHDAQDPVLMHHIQAFTRLTDTIQWIGYLSSTSVYGDYQGAWVNEQTPTEPCTQAGIQRLKTEQAWFELARNHQLPLHFFRLSGIYGPGRNAIKRILNGKNFSIIKPGHVFSRIYIDDIVQTLAHSINSPTPMNIFNLADNLPCESSIVDDYACELLKRPHLEHRLWSEVTLSPMEKGFYSTNRRIANTKIMSTFNLTLQAPTYREGLRKILPFELD